MTQTQSWFHNSFYGFDSQRYCWIHFSFAVVSHLRLILTKFHHIFLIVMDNRSTRHGLSLKQWTICSWSRWFESHIPASPPLLFVWFHNSGSIFSHVLQRKIPISTLPSKTCPCQLHPSVLSRSCPLRSSSRCAGSIFFSLLLLCDLSISALGCALQLIFHCTPHSCRRDSELEPSGCHPHGSLSTLSPFLWRSTRRGDGVIVVLANDERVHMKKFRLERLANPDGFEEGTADTAKPR
jgi:hypothetical protein